MSDQDYAMLICAIYSSRFLPEGLCGLLAAGFGVISLARMWVG